MSRRQDSFAEIKTYPELKVGSDYEDGGHGFESRNVGDVWTEMESANGGKGELRIVFVFRVTGR